MHILSTELSIGIKELDGHFDSRDILRNHAFGEESIYALLLHSIKCESD